MSRTITISTDVFAAIWAQRKTGEETEETILRRLLNCAPGAKKTEDQPVVSGGVLDSRNGVHFPEGFEVVRNYKHRKYRARATNGAWLREDNGKRYPTLNQLNESIAAGNENIWNGNWKYREADGTLRSIDTLRH